MKLKLFIVFIDLWFISVANGEHKALGIKFHRILCWMLDKQNNKNIKVLIEFNKPNKCQLNKSNGAGALDPNWNYLDRVTRDSLRWKHCL